MPKKTYDCLVIGGGAAGLSAEPYLTRFNRSVIVTDHHAARIHGSPKGSASLPTDKAS